MNGEERTVITPSGERMKLLEWAKINNVARSTISNRWYNGERDAIELITPDRRRGTYKPTASPVLTREKRAELLELAKYSEGMPEQEFMLCDFVPCSHIWADDLMEALGLT